MRMRSRCRETDRKFEKITKKCSKTGQNFTLNAKVNAVPEKLRFIRSVFVKQPVIVHQKLSQLELWFHRVLLLSLKTLHRYFVFVSTNGVKVFRSRSMAFYLFVVTVLVCAQRDGTTCCKKGDGECGGKLKPVGEKLSRAGRISSGSFLCERHKYKVLREDRCSCPSIWGHSESLHLYIIPGRLYPV